MVHFSLLKKKKSRLTNKKKKSKMSTMCISVKVFFKDNVVSNIPSCFCYRPVKACKNIMSCKSKQLALKGLPVIR